MDRLIALGKIQLEEDGTYRLPVKLEERAGILSGTLRIGYGPGTEVVSVTAGAGYDGFLIAHNGDQEGVRIGFAGSRSGVNGPGEVVWISLRNTGDTPLRLSLDRVSLNGKLLVSGVRPEVAEVEQIPEKPLVYALHPNHPNPFNPQTTITYDLPEASLVSLVIYNVMGQAIRALVGEQQEAGAYQVAWDGRDGLGREVGSGVYLVQMHTRRSVLTRKVLLLR